MNNLKLWGLISLLMAFSACSLEKPIDFFAPATAVPATSNLPDVTPTRSPSLTTSPAPPPTAQPGLTPSATPQASGVTAVVRQEELVQPQPTLTATKLSAVVYPESGSSLTAPQETPPVAFDSLQPAATAVLARGGAQIITPGELVQDPHWDGQETLFSLNAKAGESYFLIARFDGYGRMELFSPANEPQAQVPTIAPFIPALKPFTAAADGEYIITLQGSYVSPPEEFSLIALRLQERNPGVVDLASGEINGGCRDFGYTKIPGEKIVVYAAPSGPTADKTDLTIKIIGSSGGLISEQHNRNTTGQPVAFEHSMPTDGNIMVRVCERNNQAATFSLAVLALTAELGAPKAIRSAFDLNLDAADAQTGAELYVRYNCGTCHGDPAHPYSNPIGPDLSDIGLVAWERTPDLTAAGYILSSLQNPNVHLAPFCPTGLPCTQNVMPRLPEVVDDPEGLADLIAYLLTLTGE